MTPQRVENKKYETRRSRVAWLLFFTPCDVVCDLLHYTHSRKNVIYLFYTIKIQMDFSRFFGTWRGYRTPSVSFNRSRSTTHEKSHAHKSHICFIYNQSLGTPVNLPHIYITIKWTITSINLYFTQCKNCLPSWDSDIDVSSFNGNRAAYIPCLSISQWIKSPTFWILVTIVSKSITNSYLKIGQLFKTAIPTVCYNQIRNRILEINKM